MINNFKDVVDRTGFYSAEILSPPGAVIFHVHAWLPMVEVAFTTGPVMGRVKVPVEDLMNVRYIHEELKSLPKSE